MKKRRTRKKVRRKIPVKILSELIFLVVSYLVKIRVNFKIFSLAT
jgi:hypothetical protein